MHLKHTKKALSLVLSLLMLTGLFALPVTGLDTTLPTRTTMNDYYEENGYAPAYTMNKWDMQTSIRNGKAQHLDWIISNSDFVEVFYPDHIYLDKSENLEDAGYTYWVIGHFGNHDGYRLMINSRLWGEIQNPYDRSEYLNDETGMVDLFENYSHVSTYSDGTEAKLLKNSASAPGNYANNRYHHSLFAEYDGFSAEFWASPTTSTRVTYMQRNTEKTTNTQHYNEYILLHGALKDPDALGSYAFVVKENAALLGATQGVGVSSCNDSTKLRLNSSSLWSSACENNDAEIRIVITVYDKAALHKEIGEADAFDAANAAYVSKYLTSGNWDAFTSQLAASKTVLATRELGAYPERGTNEMTADGYMNYIAIPDGADPAQTVIDESEAALDAAMRAVTFAASDAALYARINALETLLAGHENEYTAASVAALRQRIAEVKTLKTAKSAERTGEQYTTDGFSFVDTTAPGAAAADEQAIIDAITFPELVRKSDAPADFSEYVIWDNEHDEPDPCHTAESIATYNEKLAVIADMYAHRENYSADDQPTVDAAMDDVVAAWDALVVEHGRAAEPVWTWTPEYAKDGTTVVAYTSATAFLACDRNHAHDQTVTETDLDVTGGDPDCEHAATKTYTASVTLLDKDDVERTYTDTKTVTLPETGHDYKFREFEWTETAEGCTAKAVLVCKNDASHVVKEDAAVTYVGEANCDAEVERVYTATYDGHTEDKTVTLAKSAHDWDLTPENVVWSWTPVLDAEGHVTGYTAKATVKCRNYATHIITKDATVTSDVTKDATETEEGNTKYTATVEIEGETFTDEKNEPIPTTEHVHNYQFDRFQWKPVYDGNLNPVDFESCDAVIVCEGHPDHTYSVPLDVAGSWVDGVEPDCDVSAVRRYAVAYTFAGETHTSAMDIPAAALGHEWGEEVWTWTPVYDGETLVGYNAILTVPCVRGEHATLHDHDLVWSSTEADGSPYKLTLNEARVEPKCQVAGSVTYTPAVPANLPDGVVLDPASVLSRSVELPALDHDYKFSGFEWTETAEGYAAKAVLVCKNDASHVVKEDAEVTYVGKANCDAEVERVYTATYDGHTENKTVTLDLIDHDWKTGENDIVWTWTDNGDGTFAVTATFVCSRYDTHTVTKTATVTKKQTKDPTEDEKGETTHTATVTGLDGNEYTDEKKTEIPVLPHTHNYELDHFNWVEIKDADNNVTGYKLDMTATLVCGKDGDEKTEAVTATVRHTDPACQVKGSDVYTAVYGDHTEEKTVTLSATGHDWGAPTAKWNGAAVTVTVVCRNDASHVKTLDAAVTASVEVEPFCTTAGRTHYTAAVTYEGTEYTFENDVATPALGHDWGEWEVLKEATMTEHGRERRVCSRCGEVEERETSIQGEGSRKIQFTNMNNMHYVVQMLYHERAVYHNSEALNWYTNLPLTFRIVSYSTYDYTKYVVYVNRQIIAPNADGSYTIPAGAGYTVVTVTGASTVPENPGSPADQTPGASKGKLSFWDSLIAFFRNIADFFKRIFG